MNCKNCNNNLEEEDKYCNSCGAKVVNERITLKNMLSNFFTEAFGWDNKFFVTTKQLVLRPEKVFLDYASGVRKRYVNPITYFAIGIAISLIVFNLFSNDFLKMNEKYFEGQIELSEKMLDDHDSNSLNKESGISEGNNEKNEMEVQMASISEVVESMLKYYNFLSFLLLPFYTLIAFWVFGKPFNFGEHLFINAYLQGFLLLITIILLPLSIVTTGASVFYTSSFIALFVYYGFAYSRLYKLSIGKMLSKFLKLVVLMIAFTLFISIVTAIIMYITQTIK